LGNPPALNVIAAEACTPDFNSQDQNTSVLDVADVYTSTNEAKSDFPPLDGPDAIITLLGRLGASHATSCTADDRKGPFESCWLRC
jgi:hypothetical protein